MLCCLHWRTQGGWGLAVTHPPRRGSALMDAFHIFAPALQTARVSQWLFNLLAEATPHSLTMHADFIGVNHSSYAEDEAPAVGAHVIFGPEEWPHSCFQTASCDL